MLLIASTFCGSRLRPLKLMMWPKNGISVHLYDCLQVCLVVSKVTTIGDYVISEASYSRETFKGLINFPLKDVLGSYETEGKP